MKPIKIKTPKAEEFEEPEITSRLVYMTPSMALSRFKKNKRFTGVGMGQRPLYPTTVDRYATMLHDGWWFLSPQGIAFDWDGNVIDGQHRLKAIIDSGVSAWVFVTEGYDPACFEFMDGYRPRNAAALLQYMRECSQADAGRVTKVVRAMFNHCESKEIENASIAYYAHERFDYVTMMIDAVGKSLDGAHLSQGVQAAFCNAGVTYGDVVLTLAEVWKKEEWGQRPYGRRVKLVKDKVRAIEREHWGNKNTAKRTAPHRSLYKYVSWALVQLCEGGPVRTGWKPTVEGSFRYPEAEVEIRDRVSQPANMLKPVKGKKVKKSGKVVHLPWTGKAPRQEVLLVTAGKAHEFLSKRPRVEDGYSSRPSSPRVVRALTEAMRAGKFLTTNQGIEVDSNGCLINGTNICHAIIACGKPQRVLVTTGVDPQVRFLSDAGRVRSAADMLACIRGPRKDDVTGEEETKSDRQHAVQVARSMLAGINLKGKSSSFGNSTIAAYANHHYNLILRMYDAVKTINRWRMVGITAAFCNAVLHYREVFGDDVDVVEVLEVMAQHFHKGVPLCSFDPLLKMRKHIVRVKQDVRKMTSKKSDQPDLYYGLMLPAIRAAMEGRRLTTLAESRVDFTYSAEEQEIRHG